MLSWTSDPLPDCAETSDHVSEYPVDPELVGTTKAAKAPADEPRLPAVLPTPAEGLPPRAVTRIARRCAHQLAVLIEVQDRFDTPNPSSYIQT